MANLPASTSARRTEVAMPSRQPSIGAVIEYAGTTVSTLDTKLKERQQQAQKERDAIAATAAFSQFTDVMRPQYGDFLSRRGAGALGVTQDYGTVFEQNETKITEQFDNENQTQLFRKLALSLRTSQLNRLQSLEATEHQVAKTNAEQSLLTNINEAITDDPFNEVNTENLINTYKDGVISLYPQQNKTTDIAQGERVIRQSIINNAIVDNPRLAEQSNEKWKTEIGLDNYTLNKKKMIAAAKERQEKKRESAQKNYEKWLRARVIKDVDAIQASINKDLDYNLEGRLFTRDISQSIGNAIKRGDITPKDNPVIKTQLMDRIAMGQDIQPYLLRAYETGDISATTFTQLNQKINEINYKQATAKINQAFKVSPFDPAAFSPDKNQQLNDAYDIFNSQVESGVDPEQAANNTIGRFDRRRTVTTLPIPLYLGDNDKTNLAALKAAQQKTVEAYTSGNLSAPEFNKEAELLDKLINLSTDAKIEISPEALKRAKK